MDHVSTSAGAIHTPDATPIDSDVSLLHRHFAGDDPHAMEVFYGRHCDMMYRIALGHTHNAADAEDIVQTALVTILIKGRECIEHANPNIRAWIARIVWNECRTKLKTENRRTKREKLANLDRVNTFTLEPESSELVSAAIKSVDGLPDTYRWPVWLHYLEGLSYDEIANVLAVKEKTVRQQARRGIEQVREALTAAGFTASMAALPAILSQAVLRSAPVALSAAAKSVIAGNAAGSSAGAGAVVVKGAFAATRTKIASAVAIAIALVAFLLWYFKHAVPPAPVSAASVASTAASTAEPLDARVDFHFWREYPGDVLKILEIQAGLKSTVPPPLEQAFTFTLQAKNARVRDVLDKLAADGHLQLEFQPARVMVWRAADEAIKALDVKLHDPDRWARCDAAWELGKLGDKRIYPLLLKACSDPDAGVAYWALRALDKHANVLPFIESPDRALLLSAAQRASAQGQLEMLERCRLLGAASTPASTDLLESYLNETANAAARGGATPEDDTHVSYQRYCAVNGLGYSREPRALGLLLDVAAEAATTDVSIGRPFRAARVDFGIKRLIPAALARCGDPRAFDAIQVLSKSLTGGERKLNLDSECAVALSMLRTPAASLAVAEILAPGAMDAKRVLANSSAIDAWDPRVAAVLTARLVDGDPMSRQHCIMALAKARDPRAVAPLMDDIGRGAGTYDGSPIQDYLAPIRDPCAEESLRMLAQRVETHFFSASIPAFPGPVARAEHLDAATLKLLEHADLSTWADRGKSLVQTRDPLVVDTLMNTLKDRDKSMDVRTYAVRALADGLTDQQQLSGLFAYLQTAEPELLRAAALENAYWKAVNPRLNENAGWLDAVAGMALGSDQGDCLNACCALVLVDSPKAQQIVIRAIRGDTPMLRNLGAGLFDPRRMIDAIGFLKAAGKMFVPAAAAAPAPDAPAATVPGNGGNAGVSLKPGWLEMLEEMTGGSGNNYRKTALYLIAWIESPTAMRSTVRAVNGDAALLHDIPLQIPDAGAHDALPATRIPTADDKDDEPALRSESLSLVDELAAMFHASRNEAKWDAAVHGISRAQDPLIIDALLQRLRGGNGVSGENDISTGETRNAELFAAMEELLSDPNLPGRLRVGVSVDLFRRDCNPPSIARLIEQLDNEYLPWDQRRDLIYALEDSAQPAAIAGLVEFLSDENANAKSREDTAATLSAAKLRRASRDALLALVRNTSIPMAVRVRTAVMLAGCSAGCTPSFRKPDDAVIDTLMELLHADGIEDNFQRLICDALSECSHPRARRALLAALDGTDSRIKLASAVSLAVRRGDQAAVSPLIDMLRNGTAPQQAEAANALILYKENRHAPERKAIGPALDEYQKAKGAPNITPPAREDF